MRYASSRVIDACEAKAYRIYVTDALKLLTENTAKQVGGNVLTARFCDLISGKQEEEPDGDAIVNDILSRIKRGNKAKK